MQQTTTPPKPKSAGLSERALAQELETAIVQAVDAAKDKVLSDRELGFSGIEERLSRAKIEAVVDYGKRRSELFQFLDAYHELKGVEWTQLHEAFKAALRKAGITPIQSREEVPVEILGAIEIATDTRHLRDALLFFEEGVHIPYLGDFGIEEVFHHEHEVYAGWCDRHTKALMDEKDLSEEEARKMAEENLLRLVHRERVVGVLGLSVIRNWSKRSASVDEKPPIRGLEAIAKALHVDKRTARRYIHDREGEDRLKAYYRGRKLFCDQSEIERFNAHHTRII